MTKQQLKQLIKEVIDKVAGDSIQTKTIISKLRSTQDDVRGVNVSEISYFPPNENSWTKKYDKGFGIFLVLPRNKNVEYYSATVIPLDNKITYFDLDVHYDKDLQGRAKPDLHFKKLNINMVVKTLKFYKD